MFWDRYYELICINDIADNISNKVLMFADDIKLYSTVDSMDDENSLLQDLNKIVNWSDKWLLKLNPTKCKVLTISNTASTVKRHHVL